MKIDRPQQENEGLPETADSFNRKRLNSVDAFNAGRIHSNLNGGSYAAGLVVPKKEPKKKSSIVPSIVTFLLFVVVLAFAGAAAVVTGLVKVPPSLASYLPPAVLTVIPDSSKAIFPAVQPTVQVLLPGETGAPTAILTPVMSPAPLITSTPTITPIPPLDLNKPTVLCNDGAKVTVAYSRGACNFHGGMKELLQQIPELPK
jgi:hypothetical protein